MKSPVAYLGFVIFVIVFVAGLIGLTNWTTQWLKELCWEGDCLSQPVCADPTRMFPDCEDIEKPSISETSPDEEDEEEPPASKTVIEYFGGADADRSGHDDAMDPGNTIDQKTVADAKDVYDTKPCQMNVSENLADILNFRPFGIVDGDDETSPLSQARVTNFRSGGPPLIFAYREQEDGPLINVVIREASNVQEHYNPALQRFAFDAKATIGDDQYVGSIDLLGRTITANFYQDPKTVIEAGEETETKHFTLFTSRSVFRSCQGETEFRYIFKPRTVKRGNFLPRSELERENQGVQTTEYLCEREASRTYSDLFVPTAARPVRPTLTIRGLFHDPICTRNDQTLCEPGIVTRLSAVPDKSYVKDEEASIRTFSLEEPKTDGDTQVSTDPFEMALEGPFQIRPHAIRDLIQDWNDEETPELSSISRNIGPLVTTLNSMERQIEVHLDLMCSDNWRSNCNPDEKNSACDMDSQFNIDYPSMSLFGNTINNDLCKQFRDDPAALFRDVEVEIYKLSADTHDIYPGTHYEAGDLECKNNPSCNPHLWKAEEIYKAINNYLQKSDEKPVNVTFLSLETQHLNKVRDGNFGPTSTLNGLAAASRFSEGRNWALINFEVAPDGVLTHEVGHLAGNAHGHNSAGEVDKKNSFPPAKVAKPGTTKDFYATVMTSPANFSASNSRNAPKILPIFSERGASCRVGSRRVDPDPNIEDISTAERILFCDGPKARCGGAKAYLSGLGRAVGIGRADISQMPKQYVKNSEGQPTDWGDFSALAVNDLCRWAEQLGSDSLKFIGGIAFETNASGRSNCLILPGSANCKRKSGDARNHRQMRLPNDFDPDESKLLFISSGENVGSGSRTQTLTQSQRARTLIEEHLLYQIKKDQIDITVCGGPDMRLPSISTQMAAIERLQDNKNYIAAFAYRQ